MSNLTKLMVQFSVIEVNIAEFIHCWLFQLPLRVIWAPQSRLPHGIYSMKNSAQANIGCVPSGSPYIFFHCFAGINRFSSCLFQNLLDSSCMDECLDPRFFATWFIFSELKCGIVAFQKKGLCSSCLSLFSIPRKMYVLLKYWSSCYMKGGLIFSDHHFGLI